MFTHKTVENDTAGCHIRHNYETFYQDSETV